jgi:hypothetical protein
MLDSNPRIGVRLYEEHIGLSPSKWAPADYVAVNFNLVNKMTNDGVNPKLLLEDNQNLVIVGASKSNDVQQRTLADRVSLVAAVEPDVYIPDFGNVALRDPRGINSGGVEAYITGYTEVADRLANADCEVTLRPMVKGVWPEDYNRYRELLPAEETEHVAIYLAEFGLAPGNNSTTVRSLARRACTCVQPGGMMAIGRVSPRELENLPARVTSACGLRVWQRGSASNTRLRVSKRAVERAREALSSEAGHQVGLHGERLRRDK